MIGFHFQATITDWPRAVAMLPAGTPIKAVDRPDILRVAKEINGGVLTVLRHWYDQGQHYDNVPYAARLDRARAFFLSFIDGTFATKYAGYVDVIETWNETLANSQSDQEQQWRVDQERAFCEVWAAEYAAGYPGIRLCLANAAVGNDIPAGIAALAHQYGHYLGYHPYIAVYHGEADWPDEQWFSLRHMRMDAEYRADGYAVKWLFTEGGPVRDMGGGSLDPQGGWRHPEVCNGDRQHYAEIMAEWAQRVSEWNQANGGRAQGVTLFTSYKANDHQWKHFHTQQPEMDMLAQVAIQYPPGAIDPPPAGREWAKLVYLLPQDATVAEYAMAQGVAYPTRSEITFSADSAFARPDNVTEHKVIVYVPERWGGADALEMWVDAHYAYSPATEIQYRGFVPAGFELAADVSQWQGVIEWEKMREMMQGEGLE